MVANIMDKLGSEMLPQGQKAIKVVAEATRDSFDEHGAEYLSGLAVVGLGATVYLALKAAPRVEKALEERPRDADETKLRELTGSVKTCLRVASPAILAGLATTACIVGSNRVQAAKLADAAERVTALTAAYKLATHLTDAERREAVKRYGEEASDLTAAAAESLSDEADSGEWCDVRPEGAVVLNRRKTGDSLYYDTYTGMCFWSSEDKVDAAFWKMSVDVANGASASVADLYEELTGCSLGEPFASFGWTNETDSGGKATPYWHQYNATLMPDMDIPKRVLDYENSLVTLV